MRQVLIIDDPALLGELEPGGAGKLREACRRLAEQADGDPVVVVVSQLHGDDLLPERLGDMRAVVERKVFLDEMVPRVVREPVERPWLDQRRCRPRKVRRWGKGR